MGTIKDGMTSFYIDVTQAFRELDKCESFKYENVFVSFIKDTALFVKRTKINKY